MRDSRIILCPPKLLPPFLGPAIASGLGSAFAWHFPDWRAVFVVLVLFFLVNHLVIHWPGRLTGSILCLCFMLCASRQMIGINVGLSAQTQMAGGIHTVEATVHRAVERSGRISESDGTGDWGRAVLRLPDRSLVQLSGPVSHLLPGQGVRLVARFIRPSPQRNPGGYDEARMLAREGIFLKAELLLGRIEVTDPDTDLIQMAVRQIRSMIARAALLGLPDRQAALLLGILIGDTSRMSNDEKQAFQDAGLSHLMAVSGANVTFVLVPVVFLLRRAVGRRRVRSVLQALFLLAFGFLTGWEPSVTRAILMMALMLAGQVIYRRSDPANALLFAATTMLMLRPLLVISTSFLLSFFATTGILLFGRRLEEWLAVHAGFLPSALRQLLSINLAVQIAVMPIQMLISGQLSPSILLANLPAMPLAEGATFLGAVGMLVALPILLIPATSPFLPAAAAAVRLFCWPSRMLLQALSHLASLFADPFWPRLLTGTLPNTMIAAYVCLAVSFLVVGMKRSRLQKLAVILLMASVLLHAKAIWTRPEVEMIILDVGQGDCALIRSRDGMVTLIDAGTETAGKQVVRPALRALGIASVDQAILTHGHHDHAGGLLSLLADGTVKTLYLSAQAHQLAAVSGSPSADRSADGLERDMMTLVLEQADERGIAVHPLQKGDTIPISENAELTVLAPEDEWQAARLTTIARSRGANAFNLVMRLSTPGLSMLLTGDCDSEMERNLLDDPLVDTDLLRVAHHGSASTTSQQLLEAVTPSLALVSVGRNDYGHPAQVVLDRLSSKRVPVLRTDRQGAITIQIDAGRSTVHAMIADNLSP